ncbi:MAG: hypothetical protein Q8J68_14730 [Methanolobus sp.]|uniref:hypothetical protein n=1 Tax=Methanolobus sp. TaxID=1874737 RepID=UPI002730D29C|nr:hypothetical protein [Methanolobus sp.]MDP2218530.1 hypothetical protein [Methanolobus sp.]
MASLEGLVVEKYTGGPTTPRKALMHVLRANMWEEWDGRSLIDLTADIEITGTPVLNRGFTPSNAGNNIVVDVGAAQRIKVYKALLSSSADITGEVYLSVGTTKIGSVRNPLSGAQYVLLSCFPDFEYGALGEDLILNLPSAVGVSLNVSYEVA